MPQYSTVFEIDTHVRMTTICALDAESGEYACRMFKGNGYTEMREWMGGFPQAHPRHQRDDGGQGLLRVRVADRDDAQTEGARPAHEEKEPAG